MSDGAGLHAAKPALARGASRVGVRGAAGAPLGAPPDIIKELEHQRARQAEQLQIEAQARQQLEDMLLRIERHYKVRIFKLLNSLLQNGTMVHSDTGGVRVKGEAGKGRRISPYRGRTEGYYEMHVGYWTARQPGHPAELISLLQQAAVHRAFVVCLSGFGFWGKSKAI